MLIDQSFYESRLLDTEVLDKIFDIDSNPEQRLLVLDRPDTLCIPIEPMPLGKQ